MKKIDKNILAIIPARGGSKGIRKKNLQKIGKYTLVDFAINTAKQSKHINRILLTTDDEAIKIIGKNHNVTIFDRPEEFRHDNSIQEVDRLLIDCIKKIENSSYKVDIVVLLYPTSPLRKVETVDKAIELVLFEDFDSVLSLYEDKTYLWKIVNKKYVEPINYDPHKRGPRQKEYWNQYAENKAIYVMKRDLLMETGCRLGGNIGYVLMDKLESFDIDSYDDLYLAKMIYEKMHKANEM